MLARHMVAFDSMTVLSGACTHSAVLILIIIVINKVGERKGKEQARGERGWAGLGFK